MEKALVIGSRGQDGTLLAQHLNQKGYEVHGLHRSSDAPVRDFISETVVDICDQKAFTDYLAELAPEMIFHLAAVHGSAGTQFEDVWHNMIAVNVLSVQTTLEYMRKNARECCLVYASSSKVFDIQPGQVITKDTPLGPANLYGISKITATQLIQYYRRQYNLTASSIHLFNHESPLRPADYFIPKLVGILAGAILDKNHRGELFTLDFHNIWGSAAEYMALSTRIAEERCTSDFVMGSKDSIYGRDLADLLFTRFGLDYRDHIIEQNPGETRQGGKFQVDETHLRACIGTGPTVSVIDVCLDILRVVHEIDEAHD